MPEYRFTSVMQDFGKGIEPTVRVDARWFAFTFEGVATIVEPNDTDPLIIIPKPLGIEAIKDINTLIGRGYEMDKWQKP